LSSSSSSERRRRRRGNSNGRKSSSSNSSSSRHMSIRSRRESSNMRSNRIRSGAQTAAAPRLSDRDLTKGHGRSPTTAVAIRLVAWASDCWPRAYHEQWKMCRWKLQLKSDESNQQQQQQLKLEQNLPAQVGEVLCTNKD
jgi:hypothetical protein